MNKEAANTDRSTDGKHAQGEFAIGDIVEDRGADTDGRPVVVNLPPVACSEWDAYRTDDGFVTVAEDNPEYDPESQVVVVMFDKVLDDWDTEWDGEQPVPLGEAPNGAEYAFPPGRLEAVGETYGGGDSDDDLAEASADDGSEPTDEADEEDAEAVALRERLNAIADSVAELNVDDVTVDTSREVVVVEKLGKQYAIDTDGTIDEDDLLAGKLKNALVESEEVDRE